MEEILQQTEELLANLEIASTYEYKTTVKSYVETSTKICRQLLEQLQAIIGS